MEKKIKQFQENADKIAQLTQAFIQSSLKPEEVKRLLDVYAKEQSRIIDQILALSQDYEKVDKFTNIVINIKQKTAEIRETQHDERIHRLKDEINYLMEDWYNTLEEIVTGIMENRGP